MTRTARAFWTAAACALATTVSAQQPGSGNPARNDGVTTPNDVEQAHSTATPGTLTLTGCLDRANDGTYELRSARLSSSAGAAQGSAGGRATGTGGSTGAAAKPADLPATWILKSTTDLAPHVGHSVQITGYRSAPSGTAGSVTATTSSPTTTATGARMKKPGDDGHSVDVESVRMISRSCS